MMTTQRLTDSDENAKDATATTLRSVYTIINAATASMGQMNIRHVIQGDYQNYTSPFFLFDEFGPMQLGKGVPFRVDAHPHAGIIPTTYLFAGSAHHRDSMGNDFQYREGDFIQFTSGSGALHMEETGDDLFEQGGIFHGIQSWLNIPPALKKSQPSAFHIKKEDIAISGSNNALIRVILGSLQDVSSKARLLMPVLYWHVSMKENSTLELPVDKALNAFIYVLKGKLIVNGHDTAGESQAVLYERDGDAIRIRTVEAAEFLVLGGEVNNEPFVARGPFVLNNDQEIQQAYADFQAGKFGDLVATNGTRRI